MFKTILLPTDGSDQALQAARHAVGLARLCQARLVVLSVREPYPLAGGVVGGAASLQSYLAESQEAAEKAFVRVRELAEAAGVAIETRIDEDRSAAQGIVEVAQEAGAQLIVIGSHGRSGVTRLLLGSVASDVITLTRLPVLVVR